jgi:fibronectin-binding autotransporter adhesin
MSRNSRHSRRRSLVAQRVNGKSWLRRYMRALRSGVAVASISALGLCGQAAHGATDTWIGNTSPNWATPTNWSALPVTGDSLVFGAPGSAGTTLNDNLMTGATYSLGTITFNAGAPTYTINAASGTRGFTFAAGSIINNSGNAQNFNDNIVINTSATAAMTAGNLSLGGVLSGPGSVIASGTGTLTLSGNNTFAGGVTLNAGTGLILSRGTAVGTGALTIAGVATLDASAPITLTNNNAININDNLTFVGTRNLNLGTGTVTLGGAAGQRVVTVANGTLTTGPIKSVVTSGTGLSVIGPGVLTITAANNTNAAAVQTVVEGNLDVAGNARINLGFNDTFFGGLTGSGIVANGSNTTRWVTVGSNNTDTTFSGSLIDGGPTRLGLRKRGTGTLSLTGANTLSDQLTVENGTLRIASTGSITPGFGNGNNLIVGNTLGQKGVMRIEGGTVQVQTVAIGQGLGNAGNNTNNVSGAIIQTGGTLQILNVANTNNFRIGDGAASGTSGNGGYGYYNLSGATSQANLAEFAVGGGNNNGIGNIGVMDMSAGTINDVGWITIARGNASTGIMNVTGGAVNYTNAGGGRFYFGGAGGAGWYGVVNVSNAVIQNPLGSNVNLELADTAGGTGIVNLGPGAVFRAGNVGSVNAGSTTYLNFTGGTLQAAVSNANFMNLGTGNTAGNSAANLTGVIVYDGGGTIDNSGVNIGVGRALQAPTGDGVTTIPVTDGGSGYVGAPAVVVTGAAGASAYANMISDGAGGLKIGSITVTSPGINASGATVELRGGAPTVAATIGTIATATNATTGGMTFKGSGVTTLSGVNTYGGATNITGGTLALTGSIDSSTAVNVNGPGAVLRANSTISGPTVTVSNGTLNGVGSVGTAVINNGGTLSNGNGTSAALTVGSVTLNAGAKWSPVTATGAGAALNATTITATGGANSVTVSPTNTAGAWTNGVYTLASYSTLNGGTAFTSAVAGLGGRQSQTLNTAGGQIQLTIGGNYLIWTGASNANWQLAGSNNWNLSLAGTPTSYQATSGVEDAVVFNDSATGSKTIALASGNVAPPRVTFDNTNGAGDYVINGAGGIAGSGSVFINNSGTVTINSANTFTGGVTVANPTGGPAGRLNIGSDTAVGAGPLTLGLNSTIDATGGNRTLSNNGHNWTGDFTFAGTNNLNLGTAPVAITFNPSNAADPITQTNSAGTTSTVNVAASTLTVGGPVTGPGVSLVKTGAGKLVLNGPATYSQTTIIHSGELVTAGNLGTINQDIQVSPGLTDNGVFTVSGGTVNAQRIIISGNSGNGGAGSGTATMNITGGVVNSGQWFTVGSGNNAATQVDTTGTLNMSGGVLNINTGVSGAQFEIGNFANMRGVVNQTGGDINVYNGGNGISMLANAGSLTAVYNMNGGTLNTYTNGGITRGGGQLRVGQAGTGTATFNLNGGTVQVQQVSKPAAGATGIFNFDGGKLQAGQNNNTFMTGLNQANISQTTANPAIIDDNGVVIGIAINLLHGAFGATDGGLTKQGAGTLFLSGANTFNGGVRVNAGTLGINSAGALGTGPLTINAPGVTIDNTSGAAVTVTNNNPQLWNNNFSFAGTRDLNMGTGAVTLNATRTITTNSTTAGTTLIEGGVISGAGFGIVKDGAGNLALAGANAYTGPTSVLNGTLLLSGAGSVNSSSGITVNGGKLVQTSTTAVSPTVTLTSGTLDGTTTINSVNVANSINAVLTHGNSTTVPAPLTITSLAFGGSATLNIVTSDPTAAIAKIATTNLSTSAAGNVIINATNTPTGIWNTGSYALVSYSGAIGGAGFSQFVAGQFAGLGAHQTVSLTNSAGLISAVIGGDSVVWTGALDGTWSTAVQNSPKNWKLSSSGAPTDFFTNDAVSFRDGAINSNVNIAANISAAAISFTNTSATSYTVGSTGGFGISSGTVFISGGGTVTITNNNTYTGGTTLSNGKLNINSAAALGTGALSLTGGTIDNTSGAPLTLTTNNPQVWNGSFTFAGTNDLNVGNGLVTLNGASTANVAAGNLTVGRIVSAAGIGLTKTGVGTLTVDSTGGNTALSNIGGILDVQAGTVQIALPGAATASDFTVGGLTGAGTVENGSGNNTPAGQARWLFVNNAADNVFSGTLQDGAGGSIAAGAARLGLNKSGTGRLTLSGNSTLSDVITVADGELRISGSIIPANNATTAFTSVIVQNATATQNPVLSLQGGRLDAPQNVAPSMRIGGNSGQVGKVVVGPGSILNTASELWLATADGGYGVMDVSGGTITVNSWLALGRGGGQGVLNMSGGSLQLVTSPLTIGSFGGATGVVHGVVNLSGGTITAGIGQETYVGEQVNGVMNVTGGTFNATAPVVLARTNATTQGILNANGGTVAAPQFHQGAGAGIINFHGGTLAATSDTFDFITPGANTGTLAVYSYQGDAKIDAQGHSVTQNFPISAPTGNGVVLNTISASGSVLGTPVVQITGGGGTGATAVANVDSNGNLTGITITNPGVDYTSAPTFSLIGGGNNNTGVITGAASIAPNVSGGLNKVGSGTLILAGANTYTGNTTVSGGELVIQNPAAVATSPRLVINGGVLNTQGNSLALSPMTLKLTRGGAIKLDGASSVSVADSHLEAWTAGETLSIIDWNGIVNTGGGTDQVLVGATGLTAGQVSQIHFQGFRGSKLLTSGPNIGEVVPLTATTLTNPLGDFNFNGSLDPGDLSVMLKALTNPAAYMAANSPLRPTYTAALSIDDLLNVADVGLNGGFNNFDIQPMLDKLAQAGLGSLASVPEPTGFALTVLGMVPGLLLVRSWRKKQEPREVGSS